jgi:5-deoxy-glucuronate isomerase
MNDPVRDAHVVPLDRSAPVRADVTPEGAGWRHLGFQVRALRAGEGFTADSGTHEVCVVLLSGDADLAAGSERWAVAGRRGVFEGLPHALYVPPGVRYGVRATTDLELAVGTASAEGRLPARLITPDDVTVEIRGGHNATRQITHVLDPDDAEKLLCVEVYTPSGNWSSYPPHKHDAHHPGVEVDLDEVYHYRIDPPGGWALQRLYTDDRDLNDVVIVADGDTVLVRRGYHPVVMAPGYDGYYLNFLAGDHPSWVARDEPDLAWVRGQWAGREGRLELPLEGTGRGGDDPA